MPAELAVLGLFSSVTADLLRAGTSVLFTASGRSMHPAVRSGDTLRVAPATTRIPTGSIVLYRNSRGRATAHRVLGRRVRRGRELLLVRGDASSGALEIVPAWRVLGVVTQLQRGWLVRPLRRRAQRWAAVARAHLRTGRAVLSHRLRALRRRGAATRPPRLRRG